MAVALAKLLIPAAVVGVLALVATSKPAEAKAGAKPGADVVPPADVMAKIAAAFQAADPAQCRALADELERQGFKAQADDLRAFATRIDAAIKSTPVQKPPAQPTVPPSVPGAVSSPAQPLGAPPSSSGAFPVPPTAPPAVTELPEVVVRAGPSQQQRLLAGKMALMLKHAKKGSEDKALVTAFQVQELDANHAPGGAFGNVPSKADGMYGPKSALQLARHYGIVPPKPLYWSKANWHTDKTNYRTEMARFAGVDPQRADEWTNAGKVL